MLREFMLVKYYYVGMHYEGYDVFTKQQTTNELDIWKKFHESNDFGVGNRFHYTLYCYKKGLNNPFEHIDSFGDPVNKIIERLASKSHYQIRLSTGRSFLLTEENAKKFKIDPILLKPTIGRIRKRR